MPAQGNSQLPIAVRCLINQAEAVHEDADRLRDLFERIDQPTDLPLPQWAHWYALALEFKPDRIIELGREAGNSTCVFTQAAQRLGPGTAVKSFCLTEGWENKLAVADLVEVDWFEPLEVFSGDLTEVDFGGPLHGAERVLLLWDAHGHAVADHVLSHILPRLAERPHLVLCHDLDDNRLSGHPPSYEGKAFWRGTEDFEAHSKTRARVNLFWLNTWVDQAIPILDFCWRNQIALHSPGYELMQFRDTQPAAFDQLLAAIPEGLIDPEFLACHWSYFTLNEGEPPHSYPEPADDYESPRDHIIELEHALDQSRLVVDELQRELDWRRPDGEASHARIAQLEAERAGYERLVRERLALLEGELRGVHESLSWRLTEPLRRVLARLTRGGR